MYSNHIYIQQEQEEEPGDNIYHYKYFHSVSILWCVVDEANFFANCLLLCLTFMEDHFCQEKEKI